MKCSVHPQFLPRIAVAPWLAAAAGFLLAAGVSGADAQTEQRLKELEARNQQLEQRLQQQQTLLEELGRKLSDAGGNSTAASPVDEEAKRGYGLQQIRISAEGGVGVFHTSGEGRYANTDFRVDELKLFVEAPLWENQVFAFIELDLMTRERKMSDPADESFHLGEAYIDFEGISRLWDEPGMLGLRIGRLDIPFGEEYISRDAINNPLISHSLSDFWGIDEGLALYGKIGPVDYVFAVQNGGHPQLSDYNSDKSLVGRLGWNAAKGLRLSASAMRTGDLDAANDKMSEMWFGNGFLRAIGDGATKFGAEIFELDAQYEWKTGHVKAAGGFLNYHDNAPAAADSDRDVYYYFAEVLQRLPSAPKLYGAARFSQIFADGGIPVVGHGAFGKYFFTPGLMTENMWRLSAGVGYEFSKQLTVKLEYTIDDRDVVSNAVEEQTHFFGATVGFAF